MHVCSDKVGRSEAIRARVAQGSTVKSGKFGPGPEEIQAAAAIRARLAGTSSVKSGKFGPGPEE